MEKYNISLALFTWLTQASVGLVIFRSVYLRMHGNEEIKRVPGQIMLFISLLMLVVGLLFSFMHLNYPRNAYNALNNLGSSWMSREIFAEICFLTILMLWYIFTRAGVRRPLLRVTETLAIIAGLSLVYFMVRTYSLPALTGLNHPSFTLSFIITMILGGTALTSFVIKKREPLAGVRFKMLFTAVFFASFINYLIFRIYNHDIRLLDLYTILYLAAFIFSIPSLLKTFKNKNCVSDVIFLNLAIVSDFLFRVYSLTYTDPAL